MVRTWIVFGFLTVFYVIISLRLSYWQIFRSDALKEQAAAQHLIQFPLPAKRGEITTSDGFPLALNKHASLVFAQPKIITDTLSFAQKVGEVLTIDVSSMSGLIADKEKLWVALAHKVEEPDIERLTALNLKGIGFEEESKRYYPESSTASHLLGFIGSDINGKDKGYFGLEGYYDRLLRGKDGSLVIEKDVTGAPILIGESQRYDPQDGSTLRLWIDRTIQSIVERRLIEGIQKYGAKEGSVVVMDPMTGGVLAMASYPSYDPRAFWKYDKSLYVNPVVGSTYEPGSTFKSLIMAAGLSEGVIKPDTKIDEKGPLEVSGYTIRTWNDKYYGEITMTDVLVHSSNVGMVSVGRALGKDKLIRAIRNFGFGKTTNIDLEDESSPTLRDDKDWYEIDLATASFGQGIAVTPIQMVTAVSSLANGGILLKPMMVKEIIDKNGKVTKMKPQEIRRVITEKASQDITDMMVATVEQGESKWAKPKGYRIAGKTGTAQIAISGHYDEKKTIASFVGFAPSQKARFVMLVTLREPSSSQWGSETAAPLFFKIASDLLTYLGIPARL